MTAINQYSLGVDVYEHWTLLESLFADIELLKEIDSFHFEMCIKCNYHAYKPIRLRARESLPEALKGLHDELTAYYAKNKERRKLKITKGTRLWHYVCDKCAPPETQEKNNADQLKKLVSEFLNK